MLIEAIFGIAAGILSAVKKYSFWDMLVTLSTSVLVSIPVFWLGMLLQMFFGIKFKQWGLPYLPMSGMSSRDVPFVDALHPAGAHSGLGLHGLRGPHRAEPAAGGHGAGLHAYRGGQRACRAARSSGGTA